MDRIHDILNNLTDAAQKTYKGQKRSDLKDSDFLFPETRSFPIVTPQDIPDAISNFGRMKGKMSYDDFLRKLYNMAKRKGPSFVAALPEATKKKLNIKSAVIPVPTVVVQKENDEDKSNINPELVDESNNKKEYDSQKNKINILVPKSPNTDVSLPNGGDSEAACKMKAGDTVQNINESCMHYGSVGTVEGIEELPDQIGNMVVYRTVNSGKNWKEGDVLRKTPDQLKVVALNDIQLVPHREPVENTNDFDDLNSIMAENEMEVEEPSETEDELEEYKNDFYSMSIGSLRAIMQHAHNILAAVDNPRVKENLTESWLQGKIAITEDYMRTIHDFVMYVSEAADTISAADRPGLWENIRKKKERMGKNYKPAKPGDKDRPDPEQWKKLQEKDTKKQ